MSFTEEGDEIHVCAMDGEARVTFRGEGKLVGNVLSAEPGGGSGEGTVRKFIFGNKGRTVVSVWQSGEKTSVAAGTEAVESQPG